MVSLTSCIANELSVSYRADYYGTVKLTNLNSVISALTCLKPMQEQQIKGIAPL